MRILFILFIGLLVGCRGTAIDFELKGEEDKLVVSSHLKANSPIRIQVTHSFKPSGTIASDVSVNTAQVLIFEENVLYATAKLSDQPGVYVSDSIIKPNKYYSIKVLADGYPTAESSQVAVPASAPSVSYTITKNAWDSKYPMFRKDKISLVFDTQSWEGEQYLAMAFIQVYDDNITAHWWLDNSSQLANEEDCHTFTREELSKYSYGMMLFSNQCLPPKDIALDAFVATHSSSIDSLDKNPKKILLRLAAVNKEWFLQAKVEYDQPSEIDRFVLAPLITKSNIKNGYGLIYASTETIIEIE